MQISYYELKNIINSQNYTKSRKLMVLQELGELPEVSSSLYTKLLSEILGGETEDAVLARFEDEESVHWIHHYANTVTADLLTLGKVQPETMLAISLLPTEDFQEIIKLATIRANQLNNVTMEVERKLRLDTVPTEIV
jgi:hypothetical protein